MRPHVWLVSHCLHAGRHSKGPLVAVISACKCMLRAGGDVVDVRHWLHGRRIEAVGGRGEDGPAAAFALLLEALGRGLAQRQVWFGRVDSVGRVGGVHGLGEGLGEGWAGLQQQHARSRGAWWVVFEGATTAGFAKDAAASV